MKESGTAVAVPRTDLEQRQEAARLASERRDESMRALAQGDRVALAHKVHAEAMERRDRLEIEVVRTFEEIERAQEQMAHDAKAATDPEFSPMLKVAWEEWKRRPTEPQ